MKKMVIACTISVTMMACQSNERDKKEEKISDVPAKDTFSYPYKASYSSDISVPGRKEYALLTLKVWKYFEQKQIDSLNAYFADTITYHDANGMNFHSTKAKLIELAKKDVEGLDSLRFDMTAWQASHINDKNEDWVNIWAVERVYPKNR